MKPGELRKGDVVYLAVVVHGLGRGTRCTVAAVDNGLAIARVRVRRSQNAKLEVYDVLVGQLVRERPPTLSARWV